MNSRVAVSRLVGVALALSLLGTLGCSDDSEPEGKGSSSTEETSGKSDGGGGKDDGGESTDGGDTTGDDGTTGSSAPENPENVTVPIADDLTARLPEVEGYTREDGDDSFSSSRCDGEPYSAIPDDQANADYTADGADSDDSVTIGVIRFGSTEDAESFWEDVTSTVDDCVNEDSEVGDPQTLDFGDETLSYVIDHADAPTQAIVVSRSGEEIWLLIEPFADGQDAPSEDLVGALESAVEG